MKNHLSIIHIIPNIKKGGEERLAITICNALAHEKEVEVKLISFSSQNEYTKLISNNIWEIIPSDYIPSVTKKPYINIQNLQAFINDFAPHIIHTNLWKAEIVSPHIQYPNAKWFSHVHDNMPQLKKLKLPITKKNITNWYERSIMILKYKATKTHFITISHHTFNYIQNNIPEELKKNVHLLHNAIDVQNFVRPPEHKKNNTTLQLVSVGSLVRKKNHAFLIRVIQELRALHIDCVLHILGEGPQKSHIEQLIQKHSLQNHIQLHGNVDVETFYWNADIYVHSALYEPFGLVLIEAMAAGLPIVCLNGKGNADIIQHSVNGFMVPKQNAKVFAEHIRNLWENKQLYSDISRQAYESAQQYSIHDYIKKLLALYQQ